MCGSIKPCQHEKVNGRTFIDMELKYKQSKNVSWTLRGSNIFDTFSNKLETRKDMGLLYSQRGTLSYDGGSAYLRFTYQFEK